jgi:DNA repair exonuclease SbcCD nuclease subunit
MTNLFKRAAFFTDIHYGLKSNSVQHNEDCDTFIDWFIDTAKKNGCETGFFLGDWHNHRSSINVQTLHYSLKALEKLNAAFSDFYFLVGNHDLFFRAKRDVHSVEFAQHLPNIHIVNDFTRIGDVVLAPWLVEGEWEQIKTMSGKYFLGHLELPTFLMNSFVEMPDHKEIQSNHFSGFDHVFSGHFHKRQTKNNITYIGNAFPHNFSDAGDDERGMMILSWGEAPVYHAWPDQPLYRVHNLSRVLDDPERLLLPNSHVRINLDIPVSYEEANFIREELAQKYRLRDVSLIPARQNLEDDQTNYQNTEFESVDSIIQRQISELEEGTAFDKQLLLQIYQAL